jgi:hypothetical protein
MKCTQSFLTAFLLLLVPLGACKTSTLSPGTVDPEPGVATDIELTIFSDGWGSELDATVIPTEGSVVIDVYEQAPYSDPPAYYIYARANTFYTELYTCTRGNAIDVDLDAVPPLANTITGVIFATQGFFADGYFANKTIRVTGPDDGEVTVTTDDQGRYGLADVPTGTYTFAWTYDGEPFSFEVTNTSGTDYQDLFFAEPMQMAAPNLYLYPEATTQIDVTLGFPQGGHVTESDPPYNDGWSVEVDPDGLIDHQHGYLFYETTVPQQASTDTGWLLDGANLETELRSLLSRLGFAGPEIDDFIDFWLPRLRGSAWYAVYPQDPAALVTLDISPAPTRLRRVLLLIRPLEAPLSMTAPPEPAPFPRDGYVALEWGVLIGI